MNLLSDFIRRTSQLMGEEQFALFCEALQQDTPISIRMNEWKFPQSPSEARPVAWSSAGYYLPVRPTFTFDPLFHAGCYYVQEASSMFVEQVLRQYVHEAVVMLDLCAAPGGKSTLARSVLPEGSLLVANEVMRNRSQVLAENMIKWGHPGVVVTNNDPADFVELEQVFDIILTDVPCSGEGMFRKDQVAVEEWSVDNVTLCWQRQRRILRDIWGCLKPGGLLIYSTCTFNREENEDNVRWIADELGAEILPVEVKEEWGITGNLTGTDFPVYRFLPHKTIGEGLFLAVLRKQGEEKKEETVPRKTKKNKKSSKIQKEPAYPKEVKEWITCSDAYEWLVEDAQVKVFPKLYAELYGRLNNSLKILHAGITLCSLKGKDWVPEHSLAMSIVRENNIFPEVELDYKQAITYLRKEAIVLPPDISRGYVLLTYRQVPLGFAKNIGNRANNLYPQEWRIRSGYLPDSVIYPF